MRDWFSVFECFSCWSLTLQLSTDWAVSEEVNLGYIQPNGSSYVNFNFLRFGFSTLSTASLFEVLITMCPTFFRPFFRGVLFQCQHSIC